MNAIIPPRDEKANQENKRPFVFFRQWITKEELAERYPPMIQDTEREITIADAERVLAKIEACQGRAAKLVLLRNFAEAFAVGQRTPEVEVDWLRHMLRRAAELLTWKHYGSQERNWYEERDQWLRDAGIIKGE